MTRARFLVAALAAGLAVTGCATLQQVAALRKVEFDLDRVSGATLAGVQLEGKRSYRDLGTADVARLLAAVAARDVPLSMTVHVEGTNPPTNTVSARLVRMDWTLLIDDEETVSGKFDQEVVFAPGQPTDVPIPVELDLWDFFSGRAEDLFAHAQAATGADGSRTMTLALEASPTIDTPIGPIRYPSPIRIVQRDVDVP
jgi:hypothetical protein